MNEMPNCPVIEHCHCYPIEEVEARKSGLTHCVCGESEKALRGWMNGRITNPMTPEQREWCYQEIDAVEAHDRDDYLKRNRLRAGNGCLKCMAILLSRQGIAMTPRTLILLLLGLCSGENENL